MLTMVIQAGGSSVRMGQDKGLLHFRGQVLVQRLLDRVGPLGDEVLVITNRPEEYRFLGVPCFPDVIPQRGALGGLYSALHIANLPLVAVVACDMPFANPKLLAAQRDILIQSRVAAAIPRTEQGTEPFHAVYNREVCLPLVAEALEAGLWRVDSWFEKAALRFLEPGEISQYDPSGLAFLNLNTPEEARAAEALEEEPPAGIP